MTTIINLVGLSPFVSALSHFSELILRLRFLTDKRQAEYVEGTDHEVLLRFIFM